MSIATAIADAQQKVANAYLVVSNKGGTLPASRNLSNLSVAINSIPSGGGTAPVIQQLDITPTTSSQTYTPVSGVDGYGPVNVSAVTSAIDNNILATNIKSGVSILGVTGNVVESVEDTLSVTPSTSAQTFTPTSPYTGYNQINVSAVTSSIDNNIQAGNIKSGVNILGVTGTYSGGGSGYTEIPRYEVTNGVASRRTLSLTGHEFDGITNVNHYTFYYAFNECDISGSVVFNDLTTISGVSAFDHAFYETQVTSISFPELVTITGSFGTYAFANLSQAYITSVSFPKLTNAKGMQNLISGNAGGLRSLDFSALTSIDNNGMTNFTNESGQVKQKLHLTSISFPELLTIGNYGLANAFGYSSNCTSISLPKLTTVNSYGLQSTFRLLTSLTSVSFPMLTTLGSYAFNQTFMQVNNLSLSFPALTSTSFGSYTNQFNNMFSSGSNNTVHFPSNLQSVIGSWSDVINGFGGTNTTVLFDLPATETP